MKKILYVFLICCCFNCSKKSVFDENEPYVFLNELDFASTYGGYKNDVLNAVVSTIDGGYATLGYTQSNDFDITTKTNEDFDFFLMRFSSDDNLLWSKTYGGTDDDRGADIIVTSDGGFLLFGFSKSSDGDATLNAGNQDFWAIKVDTNGGILWEKSFGFSGADVGYSVMQTSDNGYLITGELDVTSSGGQGNSKSAQRHAGGDFWVIKLSSTGDKEWSRYFGGSFTDTPFGLVETLDNSYVIVGSSDSNDVDIKNNIGTYDFWVIKIATDGSLIWEKNFGGTEIDEARGITTTNDGNIIVVGDTRSSDANVSINNGAADVWIIKIDLDGNLIWEKTIGGTSFDVARSVSKTQDGGFLISGSSRSLDNSFSNNGQNDGLLVKIDVNGALIWQKTIGGSETDFLYDAIELTNQKIIAVGESASNDGDLTENKGFSDALLIKIK